MVFISNALKFQFQDISIDVGHQFQAHITFVSLIIGRLFSLVKEVSFMLNTHFKGSIKL